MIRGRVLVIDADEGAVVLVRVLQERGYVVDHCREARAGFLKACEVGPQCIVLSPELPDIDGAWVARRVRTEASSVSKVPILFVGELTDKTVRTQTLNVGADVFLARPVGDDEIVAQIEALIAMARRLDADPDDAPPSSTSLSAAIRGDLAAFPLASILMMLEMERRSGTVQVVSESGKRAILTISSGLFASTEIAGAQRPPLEVLRQVLSWRVGRFSFQARETGTLPEPRASVGALVLEAMRLEDEQKGPIPELDPDDVVEDPSRASRPNAPAASRDDKARRPSPSPPAPKIPKPNPKAAT